jgi:hypothetical protein
MSFETRTPLPLKARQAISHYKKAVGETAGLAELMVFYCEQAAGFCADIGYQEEGYFSSLVRMFERALTIANRLPTNTREALLARLDRVRNISHKFGYGVGDHMDFLLVRYTYCRDPPFRRPLSRLHP